MGKRQLCRLFSFSLFLAAFIVLFADCSSKRETNEQESATSIGYSPISSSLEDELNLHSVSTGVWLVTKDPLDAEKPLPVPLEIIHSPSISSQVKKGLRPDGKLMYRHPDSIPNGYPSDAIEHAIDIFPAKIPKNEGLSKGHVNLYGHFIEPPYKFQVVVLDKDNVGLLLNDVDLALESPARSSKRYKREKPHKRSKSKDKRSDFTLSELEFAKKHKNNIKEIANDLYCKHGIEGSYKKIKEILVRDQYVDNSSISLAGDSILNYRLILEQKNPQKVYEVSFPINICVGKASLSPPPKPDFITKLKYEIHRANRLSYVLESNSNIIWFGSIQMVYLIDLRL